MLHIVLIGADEDSTLIRIRRHEHPPPLICVLYDLLIIMAEFSGRGGDIEAQSEESGVFCYVLPSSLLPRGWRGWWSL